MKLQFMNIAVEEALKGMTANHGGPFGAVVVKDGKVIATAHNEVLSSNDPTAHAEIQAIRKASELLETFDLSACEIYSTCEPCPMCYSAIHWARIPKLYYAASRKDASLSGFDDDELYDILSGKTQKEQVEKIKVKDQKAIDLFIFWDNKRDKQHY
ncbi:MAG: nucleoside deaminase [Cytophagia bacterium]|jgi:guanine deaminase|nr:nucleoside deaminase [Cytophagia bacterium]